VNGEKEFFRKRFFGGFNRDDVINYIARLAEERNEALAAKEKAEKKARALAIDLKKLREELGKPQPEPADEPEPVDEPEPADEPEPEDVPQFTEDLQPVELPQPVKVKIKRRKN